MDDHIMSEQENVRKLQIIELKNHHRLSISLNGGALRSSKPVYTIHATTPARKVMLLEGQECGEVSHTEKWIADLVYRVQLFFYDSFWLVKWFQVMEPIGIERFIAISSIIDRQHKKYSGSKRNFGVSSTQYFKSSRLDPSPEQYFEGYLNT
jgi:hypothetical protein